MGVRENARRIDLLASAHVDVAHAGLPVVWHERRRASPRQRFPPRAQCRLAFPGAPANDGRVLAQRDGGGVVCMASVASGQCRVDRGAEERAERPLLDRRDGSLRKLRATAQSWPLSAGAAGLRAGVDVQADPRRPAVRLAAAGFLAVAALALGTVVGGAGCRGRQEIPAAVSARDHSEIDPRKSPVVPVGRRFELYHGCRAPGIGQHVCIGGHAVLLSRWKRGGVLRALPRQGDVAGAPVRVLSASGRVAGRPGGWQRGTAARRDAVSALENAARALCASRMVLVSWRIGPLHRPGPGGSPGNGGTLRLSAANWIVRAGGLERGGFDRCLATPSGGA